MKSTELLFLNLSSVVSSQQHPKYKTEAALLLVLVIKLTAHSSFHADDDAGRGGGGTLTAGSRRALQVRRAYER